jgi:hypothetical protein
MSARKPTKTIKPTKTAKPAATKKRYPRLQAHVGHAASLQQRIAAGEATPTETREYQRIINEFRRKFRDGQ